MRDALRGWGLPDKANFSPAYMIFVNTTLPAEKCFAKGSIAAGDRHTRSQSDPDQGGASAQA